MFSFSKNEMGERAKLLGFSRDTLEKVYRLVDVLEYLNANPITREILALKGGTAINLTVFNLPRLSVDIDLDYSYNDSKDEMLDSRKIITEDLRKYMFTQGYNLSQKSKYRHSLDSLVFVYRNLGGMDDNIKIEINYSLRAHIFEPVRKNIIAETGLKPLSVLSLTPIEIFAGKINALLSRAASRDLYDVHNMIKLNIFDENSMRSLRKSVVFYSAISREKAPLSYSTDIIDEIAQRSLRTELSPVLQSRESVKLPEMKEVVKSFIAKLLVLTVQEKEFLSKFQEKIYLPDLLFEDEVIVGRIREHPMALWKMSNI